MLQHPNTNYVSIYCRYDDYKVLDILKKEETTILHLKKKDHE